MDTTTDAELREWHRRMAALKAQPIPPHLDPVIRASIDKKDKAA